MTFKVSKNQLLKAIKITSYAVQNKPVVPILENILFEVNDGILKITATDLEVSICKNLHTEECFENTSFCVPHKLLLELINSIDDSMVGFNVINDNMLSIHTNSGVFKMTIEGADNFPKVKSVDNQSKINVNIDAIKHGLDKTAKFVANDDLRPAMSGVNVKINKETIAFEATNAYKLAKINIDINGNNAINSFIIPQKALKLISALDIEDTDIQLIIDEFNGKLISEDTEITFRLVDAKYPDVNSVIPKDNPNKIIVTKENILNALKRIMLFSNSTTNRIIIVAENQQIIAKSENTEYGTEAVENIDAIYKGEDIAIAFNAKYLIETINNVDTENAHIEFSSNKRPALIFNDDNKKLLNLIMPMMID